MEHSAMAFISSYQSEGTDSRLTEMNKLDIEVRLFITPVGYQIAVGLIPILSHMPINYAGDFTLYGNDHLFGLVPP